MILSPLLRGVHLTGKDLWQNCQRKTLIFVKVSIFQIHLYDHVDKPCDWIPWAAHVVDFVVELTELFNPQQKDSVVSWMGMVIP